MQGARRSILEVKIMPRSSDFEKIHARFTTQYGEVQGDQLYNTYIEKKGFDDNKLFPRPNERKEHKCLIRGLEIKETETHYHVEGLIATSHVDQLNKQEGLDISDQIPKATLDSFAKQINESKEARVMGVHHSEGKPINPEYFGEADIETTPAEVIELSDGEWGLFVDTKLLKNDPKTPEIIARFEDETRSDHLNSFSITYDTNGYMTTDFDWVGDSLVRVLNPETRLFGYTAANNPVNEQAVATGYGFKEFKELVGKEKSNKEVVTMSEEKKEEEEEVVEQPSEGKVEEKPEEKVEEKQPVEEPVGSEEGSEEKEFKKWKAEKKELEQKEMLEKSTTKIVKGVMKKMEVKEKVLKDQKAPGDVKEIPLELKAFRETFNSDSLELKEQFRRAGAMSDAIKLDWRESTTPAAESREFKNFGVNGRKLEFKGLGLATNQNADTDYLQSTAELQDVYDPVIYNALNQATVAWNLLAKDDYSTKGNNQVQFTLKTAANASAAFYTGNAVATDNVTRLKYQTKFKKLQVGVSVDGDMIAAARGGPVNDVFAQEVMDSTTDMLDVLNAALFAEVGLETASAIIGFEYLADSAGNTTLYNLTRSAANKLAPDSAGNTYVDGASAIVSMANLRALKRNATNEGANKRNLVYITNPVQGDLLRGKFDDSRRMLTSRDTDFGFSTDLWVDGIPVFEDVDCNSDDWFCIDLETHRAGIWVPPTIERLGKTADSEDAFVKMYVAIYNRAPRRIGMIYSNATS